MKKKEERSKKKKKKSDSGIIQQRGIEFLRVLVTVGTSYRALGCA